MRSLERLLSVAALFQILAPLIRARVAVKRKRPVYPLPACLKQNGKEFLFVRQKRLSDCLSEVLEFFPDKLSAVKWQERVEFLGLEHLEAARRKRKPVVLAFCHFGPFFLLRYWLRAMGFPAATLNRGEAENRPSSKWLKDRCSPFAEIPVAFYQDQLRELLEFLKAGNPLLVALDVELGRQIETPLDEQWQIQVASGAIRLAVRHNAELIPCSITDKGHWRFRIKFGPPVAEEFLRAGMEAEAAKQLVTAMLPEIRAHSEQCAKRVLNLFRPLAPSDNPANTFADADHVAAR